MSSGMKIAITGTVSLLIQVGWAIRGVRRIILQQFLHGLLDPLLTLFEI